MAHRKRCGALLLVVAVLAAACGREDVELAAPLPDGAGDAGTSDDGMLLPPGQSRTCDSPRSPGSCQENGAACSASIECCSSRCDHGVCLQGGSCAGPGVACTSRDACCSGRCEPVGGARQCLNYCASEGAACKTALDCCAMNCNAGVCGGASCRREGTCATDGECCSGACDSAQHQCRHAAATPCGATATDCDTSGGAGGCCSGVCVQERCDFGPGPCRPTGATCTKTAECCRGTCAPNAQQTMVCTAPCLADGEDCTSGSECCAHSCSGSPGKCGPRASICKLIGVACALHGECCSGQCLAGFCGSNCVAK